MNPSKLVNNFDILRLVLSILVYFSHWNILTGQNNTNLLFHLSDIAVHTFFEVSGFLIFWSFVANQNKKYFYIKRFFRIFPLMAFLVVLQTLFFIGFSDGGFVQIMKYFISNILFLNFLAPSVGSTLSTLQVDAINGSLWTLKNEVVFYFLVPFIFTMYKKFNKGSFLMMLYSLSVVYMFSIDYLGFSKLIVQFPAQVRLFVVGILLYVFYEKINKKNIYPLALLSLISLILFSKNMVYEIVFYPFAIGFLMIFLVYFAKHIKMNFDFSYSFYILHFPIIQLVLYFDINPSNPLASFIALFLIVLILSYFSEIYIEKKFISIGKNILTKNRDKHATN